MISSVVVSAGLLRIFGHEVAELPLVATSREHQGQVSINCLDVINTYFLIDFIIPLIISHMLMVSIILSFFFFPKKFVFRATSKCYSHVSRHY